MKCALATIAATFALASVAASQDYRDVRAQLAPQQDGFSESDQFRFEWSDASEQGGKFGLWILHYPATDRTSLLIRYADDDSTWRDSGGIRFWHESQRDSVTVNVRIECGTRYYQADYPTYYYTDIEWDAFKWVANGTCDGLSMQIRISTRPGTHSRTFYLNHPMLTVLLGREQ